VLLQGICDKDKLFIDCYAGEVGSVHDALVFKRSDFYKKLTAGQLDFAPKTHILGDNAYPISEHVLTPYPRSNKSAKAKRFNLRLSRARVVIEQAFGLLRGRFRRLKYMEIKNVELVPLVIIACCILHNIAILEEDWEWVQPDDGTRVGTVNVLDRVPPVQVAARYQRSTADIRVSGQTRRDVIARRLMQGPGGHRAQHLIMGGHVRGQRVGGNVRNSRGRRAPRP